MTVIEVMNNNRKPPCRLIFDLSEGATVDMPQMGGPPQVEDALAFLKSVGTTLRSPPKFSKMKRGWELELRETEEVWFRVAAHELIEAYARR
jgi:hypothetical protein